MHAVFEALLMEPTYQSSNALVLVFRRGEGTGNLLVLVPHATIHEIPCNVSYKRGKSSKRHSSQGLSYRQRNEHDYSNQGIKSPVLVMSVNLLTIFPTLLTRASVRKNFERGVAVSFHQVTSILLPSGSSSISREACSR